MLGQVGEKIISKIAMLLLAAIGVMMMRKGFESFIAAGIANTSLENYMVPITIHKAFRPRSTFPVMLHSRTCSNRVAKISKNSSLSPTWASL